MDTYITRLTWNQDQWRRPSGALGKREQGTYVAKQGFGNEEWLNRREWRVRGERYAFLQGVSKSKKKLQGHKISIILYAISPTHERVYVGRLKNAEVLSEDQAAAAANAFKKHGWIAAMKREVDSAGGNSRVFDHILDTPTEIANVRFRPDHLEIFAKPIPVPLDHRVNTLFRYQLYHATEDDSGGFRDHTRRAPLQTERVEGPIVRRAIRETIILQTESRMQREIAEVLREQFGRSSVTREHDYADIRVTGERHILIEVKADTVARRAIRNALGQLLFYAYRDGRPTPAPELVVVGRSVVTNDDERFLKTLKAEFGLNITYRQYRVGSLELNL